MTRVEDIKAKLGSAVCAVCGRKVDDHKGPLLKPFRDALRTAVEALDEMGTAPDEFHMKALRNRANMAIATICETLGLTGERQRRLDDEQAG